MNKAFLPLLLLFFCFTFSKFHAQDTVFRTTDALVTQAELENEVYPKDSTANAFYIYENGYSRFKEKQSLVILTDYVAKVKILNKEGYKHANIELRLSNNENGKEKINDLKATTYYLENGQKKSENLIPSNVYTEENPDYDLVKFTFPSVRPGAVIVYSYQKESPFFFKFKTWFFQEDIPKVYSRFVSEIPGNFNYNIKKVGHQKLDSNESEIVKNCFFIQGLKGDCVKTIYTMENIPAFVEEDYLTSKWNFMSRIEYELMEVTYLDGRVKKYTKSWEDVDRELRKDKDLGRQLRKIKTVKNILPDSIQSQPNNLNKARAIYAYVKDQYKWDGEYDLYKEMRVKDILQEKSGNVAAVNTLLHNVYKEQGFKVWPVLNSTRGNGLPTKLYPVLSEFNYLIVQLEVDGQKYILDATEKNVDFGNLPYRCLNKYARLIDFDEGSSWIDIEPQGYSVVTFRDSIKVHVDGTATGISLHSFTGHHAISVRNKLDEITTDQIFNTLSNPNTHTRVKEVNFLNNEEFSEALQLSFALHNASQKINDILYIKPFSFRFFDKNPFQLAERNYPIDFGFKDAYSYSILLEIPEGHEIIEIPEITALKLPEGGGFLQFSIQQVDERNLSVFCRVTFLKAVYDASYYPYLKEFFNTMINIQEESLIVIRQKS